MVASLENFIETLGSPGRFQIIAFVLLWSNVFPLALNNFVNVFYTVTPSHHCKILPNSTWNLNQSIPLVNENGKLVLDKCNEWVDPGNQSLGTQACSHGWTFEYKNLKEQSIVGEWDLVCERAYLYSLSNILYFLGVMLGGPFGGWAADKFGRRPLILVTMYAQMVLGLGVAFVHNFEVFVGVRFVQAILLQSLQSVSFTVAMEFLSNKHRVTGGIIFGIAWGFGTIAIALIAYSLGDWRHIQMAITAPSVISLAYFWFIPESLRWQISQQRLDRAHKLIKRIAKVNQICLPNDIVDRLQRLSKECLSESDPSKKYGFLDLVRTSTVRKYSIIMAVVWFTNSLVFYGVTFAFNKLGGNIYLSLIISGLVELPARAVMIYILTRFGRRNPIMVCLLVSGILCISTPLISLIPNAGPDVQYVAISVAILAKAFMSSAFSSIAVYTAELFPTVIRVTAQGMATTSTRAGALLAPEIIRLADITWKPIPLIIFGLFAVLSSIITAFLPDTLNKPLPDVIEDLEGLALSKMTRSLVNEAKSDKIKMVDLDIGPPVTGTVNQDFVLDETDKLPERRPNDGDNDPENDQLSPTSTKPTLKNGQSEEITTGL